MNHEEHLIRELERAKERFHNESKYETGVITDIVVAETQLVTPVLTGTLKRSITRDEAKESGDSIQCEYGTNISYAVAVNDGHMQGSKFVRGRHFVEQGVQNAELKINEELEEWLDDLLDGL